MADVEPLGRLHADQSGETRRQLTLPLNEVIESFALDQRPGQIMGAACGSHVHNRHDARMLAVLNGPHLTPGNADVPHASPRQDLDGVPFVVVLGERFVDRPHAAGAERINERIRPEH